MSDVRAQGAHVRGGAAAALPRAEEGEMSEYHAIRKDGDGDIHTFASTVDTCWFLLNDGTRACIKERGHDAGVHEGPTDFQCGTNDVHDAHTWTAKHQCEGAG